MRYVYSDGGRAAAGFRGSAGDCVVRAVAIASGRPYLEIYEAITDGVRSERAPRGSRYNHAKARRNPVSARDGVNVRRKWFRDYMERLGFVWTPTMRIGSGCRVHLREDELPGGRLVVSVSKHYVAVIDGVIHDTHDPSERGTTVYPPSFPRAELPKGATRLSNGAWAYSPERCVYGYWTLTREAA